MEKKLKEIYARSKCRFLVHLEKRGNGEERVRERAAQSRLPNFKVFSIVNFTHRRVHSVPLQPRRERSGAARGCAPGAPPFHVRLNSERPHPPRLAEGTRGVVCRTGQKGSTELPHLTKYSVHPRSRCVPYASSCCRLQVASMELRLAAPPEGLTEDEVYRTLRGTRVSPRHR